MERARRELHSAPRPPSVFEGPFAHFPRRYGPKIATEEARRCQFGSGRHSRTGASHGRPLVGSDGRFRGPWFTPRRDRRGRDVRGGIVRVRRAGRGERTQARRSPGQQSHRGDRFRPVLRGGRFGVAGVRRVLAAALRQHQRDVVRACVGFHPKFADMSAAFPDVHFITVDIDHLDDDVLDGSTWRRFPRFC